MRVAIALVFVVLAGCSGSGHHPSSPSGPSSSPPARTGRLVGHLGEYGGPARPDGGMAVSDAPLRGAAVLATATDNRRAYSTTSDAAGGFAFTVPPGRYAVTSEGCQSGTVTVRATRTTTQPLICPIP